jgi:uncharacterized phage protein (TIGR01671 family)
MRPIKFRAKEVGTGKWIYGLPQQGIDGEIKEMVSHEPSPFHSGNNLVWYKIDPKTVGQFIGRKDNKGVEVYEGDIVRYIHPAEHDLP